MNNFYTLSNSLNPAFETALIKVIRAIERTGKPYFIAGATARDIVLHGVFGHPPIRATRDIDTAIFVADWEEFEAVKTGLIHAGLEETRQSHRLREPETNLPVDIIPFGQLEDAHGHIQWPPGHEVTMSVVGFQEAFDAALTVNFQSHQFKVASLPGIVLLKLMAWDERGAENSKDATDFYTIMDKYQHIHDGRLWEDYVPGEQLDYDVERISAFLLGFDLKDLLSPPTRQVLTRIQAAKQDALMSAIARTHNTTTIDEIEEKLTAFWLGAGQ
ncbi:hypothetical protein VV869_18165 [Photobacterium sp. MCCC 1A19761]|uniref:hypothetical protein n=1 Tax=Photobacterium sp. MCCC 1A19761 TaxID=3115000 RepID=UPI00307E79B5